MPTNTIRIVHSRPDGSQRDRSITSAPISAEASVGFKKMLTGSAFRPVYLCTKYRFVSILMV